jgi:hypothetical protein
MKAESDLARRIEHQEDCPVSGGEVGRVETYTLEGLGGKHHVARCCECGGQAVVKPELRRLKPGSPEWVDDWTKNPQAITRALTPAERHDPNLNPLHPRAEGPSPIMRQPPWATTERKGTR